MVLEHRAPRPIFGPERETVTGALTALHCGGVHNLYSSLNIITENKSKNMRWMGQVAHMGAIKSTQILDRKSQGNKLLGRP
jgi:hypothetical protein